MSATIRLWYKSRKGQPDETVNPLAAKSPGLLAESLMKHRARSSKIKYQHRMIGRLRRYLEYELEPRPEVRSIIPGRIHRTRSAAHSELQVRFQYVTDTGAKLIARGPGVIQEVFVVTNDPEYLLDTLPALKER